MNYFSSELNSGFFYKTAGERDDMVKAERKFIDDRVDKIIELKKKVVGGKLGFVQCGWDYRWDRAV